MHKHKDQLLMYLLYFLLGSIFTWFIVQKVQKGLQWYVWSNLRKLFK